MCLDVFISSYFLFRILVCHRLIKNKAKPSVFNLILGGHLIGVKNNRKPSSGRPKGGRGHLIGVVLNRGLIYGI